MAWLAGQCTLLSTFVWSKVETSLVDQESSALTISAPHCSILMSLCLMNSWSQITMFLQGGTHWRSQCDYCCFISSQDEFSWSCTILHRYFKSNSTNMEKGTFEIHLFSFYFNLFPWKFRTFWNFQITVGRGKAENGNHCKTTIQFIEI